MHTCCHAFCASALHQVLKAHSMDCGSSGICCNDMGVETDVSLVLCHYSLLHVSFTGVQKDILPW